MLTGRRLLITGAASGIGRRTAELAAEAGAIPLLLDKSQAVVSIAAGAGWPRRGGGRDGRGLRVGSGGRFVRRGIGWRGECRWDRAWWSFSGDHLRRLANACWR